MCFIFIILSLTLSLCAGSKETATENFISACQFVNLTAARQRWSSPSTWPNGIVPGIGNSTEVNVTIECGQSVVLDLPNVTLSVLRIRGLLRFLDEPRVPVIHLKANFIVVEGQLFIGTGLVQYRQKAIIELTPNIKYNRAPFQYTYTAPADPSNPRNLGHKAFVVIGGQVRLFGLPGPPEMPVWVRLNRPGNARATQIYVDADVAGSWPVNGSVAIASSDYDRTQTEIFTITQVFSVGPNETMITLDRQLAYNHYGKVNGVTDGHGGFIEQRAEVALLTRNILITGTDEAAPHNDEGGHFMVFKTRVPAQHIEGVEFYKMGQLAVLGRYPIHFHLLGNAPGTVCRKNSIHRSKQRCIVVHASHNVTIDSNVAVNTTGHCFLLEDGGERHNTFRNNLGILTNSASKLIRFSDTDSEPSTFWISNPDNSYVGNVAVGSSDSGFWFELRKTVRGVSVQIPSMNSIIPIITPIRLFVGNSAHSNRFSGLKTYPNGMKPRLRNDFAIPGPPNEIFSFTSYKNNLYGMFIHHTDLLHIDNASIADNVWGLYLKRVTNVNVTASRFVSLSENYGNPTDCYREVTIPLCVPLSLSTCKMPLPKGMQGRSVPRLTSVTVRYGIVVDQGSTGEDRPHTIENVTFHNYDSTCRKAAALGFIGTSDFWNPGHSSKLLQFSNNTNRVWANPRRENVAPWAWYLTDGGEQAMFYTFYDRDGTLIGGQGGYVVANTTQILPPGRMNCTPRPEWNAVACRGVCYRSLMVYYPEPNFSTDPANTRAKFSILKVTRVSDGQELLLDGNLQTGQILASHGLDGYRYYFMSLLAEQTYRIEIVSPPARPTFQPVNLSLAFNDPGPCGHGLTVQLQQLANQPWTVSSSDDIFFSECAGSHSSPSIEAQYSIPCIQNRPWIQFEMGAKFVSQINLIKQVSGDKGICPSSLSCSLLWSGRFWLYDDSGLERRPGFYNKVLLQPNNWKQGQATIGTSATLSKRKKIRTLYKAPAGNRVTYYFRSTFNLSKVACYSALLVDIIVEDGIVLYINSKEVLRVNLPSGPISNKTLALSHLRFQNWQSYVFPISSKLNLVNGQNVVAVEQHSEKKWTHQLLFDMRMAARKLTSCN